MVTCACDAPGCPCPAGALVRVSEPIDDVPAVVRLCDEHTGLYLSALWEHFGRRGVVTSWL